MANPDERRADGASRRPAGVVGPPAVGELSEKEPEEEIEAALPRAVEFAKCAADAAYFCHHFGVIDDAQGHGEGGGTMAFHLWPAQVRVLWLFLSRRLLIILKARQLGISWLCCIYALWLCLFQPGKVVLCFSKGQMEANELIRRVRVLYERLPDWLREALPALERDNTEEMGWANGSRVRSLPATESAGRSMTASLVILDEAAFLQWAGQLYTALKPTIDGGGQLIILSTANGLGNLFHRLWTRAISGLNAFETIFLPWWARPGRDRAWYNAQIGEYTDPQMVKQEYPATAQQAFIASGRSRFAAEWIEAQADNALPPLETALLPYPLQGIRGLSVYVLPQPGRHYILAADVAEGLAHGDYSVGTLIDRDTWEEVAALHGHWEPDIFADYLLSLSDNYAADIAVERNNHGHAVLAALKLKGCTRIAEGMDERPGWLTNAQSKPLAVDLLAEALRDHLCKVRTPAALDEMQVYCVLDNGKTGAPEGYHDDRVMSWAIAVAMARHKKTRWGQDASALGKLLEMFK